MITRCCLLLGGYFVVYHDVELKELEEMFAPISGGFVPMRASLEDDECVTVLDCWRALHHTKRLNWYDFTTAEVDIDRCIDMQEYLHYDNPANGSMHSIVPGKLLAFSCPAQLPDGVEWADAGGARSFSAGYFADIFGDFGVRMVVRCGGATYDARAFERCGIGVEDLLLGAAGPAASGADMLRAVDRFMTLTRLSPGAVAVHGGAPDGSLGPGGRLLVEAYLIRRHGFGGPDALAWALMAQPAPAMRAAALGTVEETAGGEFIGRAASSSEGGDFVCALDGLALSAPARRLARQQLSRSRSLPTPQIGAV